MGEAVNTSPVNTRVPPHDPVNHSVEAPVPFIPPATVSTVLLPLQIVVVPVAPVGATDAAFTVMFALAGVVSLEGTLSTCAFTVAAPAVPFEVNVAVAVPAAWIVACCPDRLPKVEVQVTGNPISRLRLATGIASPAELERKLAVTVEVLLPELQIGVGEAEAFSCSHLVKVKVPPAGSLLAWLQGAVEAPFTGFVLQPHQLFSASTLPAPVI